MKRTDGPEDEDHDEPEPKREERSGRTKRISNGSREEKRDVSLGRP